MRKLVSIIAEDAVRVCERTDLNELNGKTILITGASGLLGGYFLACLKHLRDVHQLSFAVVPVVQTEPAPYLLEFLKYEGVGIYRGDLTDFAFCTTLPKADYIIHAAGYAQPGRFMETPIKTIQLNTSTLLFLFERLATNGKLLFISSAEVYSGLTSVPFRESDIGTTNTTHPRACYIEAKRCGEAICNSYRASGVNAKSARLALAYGPGTKKGDLRVLNSFIQKALTSGNITLLDQGNAWRTYCYVSDAIEIMWKILLFGSESVYNVGGLSTITIADLAHKIGKYLGVPVVLPANSQSMAGAPGEVTLDMTKVRKEFKKTEYVSFDAGLSRTIEWQKELYALP